MALWGLRLRRSTLDRLYGDHCLSFGIIATAICSVFTTSQAPCTVISFDHHLNLVRATSSQFTDEKTKPQEINWPKVTHLDSGSISFFVCKMS